MMKQLGAAPSSPDDAATKAYVDSVVLGGSSTPIQEYADLNTLTQPCALDVVSAAVANTLKNMPVPAIPGPDSGVAGVVRSAPVGTLYVRNVAGRVHQEYVALVSVTYGRVVTYSRFRSADGYWQPWVWANGSGVHQANGAGEQRDIGRTVGATDQLPVSVRRTDWYPTMTLTTTNGDTWQVENGTFATSPSWDTLPLKSPWANYGSAYRTAQVMRNSAGIVMLRGLIKAGTYGTFIGTLPEGYRPPFRIPFSVAAGYTIDSVCRVDIFPNGNIYLSAVGQPGATGALGFLSLSGIAFPCAQVAPAAAWTSLTMVNGFVDYSLTRPGDEWGRCSYWEDPLGRVWLAGIASRATMPTETITYARLPTKYAIDRPIHLQGYSGAGFRSQDYGNVGGVELRWKMSGPMDVSYFTLPTAPILPTALFPNASWRVIGLQGAWVTYDASQFPSPSTYYAADGIVHMRGLVKNGGAGVLGLLDIGYRSEQSLDEIFATNANNDFSRVDVGANRLANVGGSNLWRSLDGIFYLREG